MADFLGRFDVAVVGGGPAGVAAACRAAEAGARATVLDEGLAPGGQLYRRRPGEAPPEGARRWLDRFSRSGAALLSRASVFDVARDGEGWRLVADSPVGRQEVRAERVVLATGARELFLPFPGWTLPGVMGAGAAQALLKAGMDVRGHTAVVAGSGPLLLPVAASLAKAGATVAVVADQASLGALAAFAVGLARAPRKLIEGVGYRAAFSDTAYRTGLWVTSAWGRTHVTTAVLADGRAGFKIPCDLLCVSYGLVPNTELPRLLGCAVADGDTVVNPSQETSVPGVFCAGEPCGIAGADAATVEGEIAGLAAAGCFDPSRGEGRRLARRRAAGRRYATALKRAFRLRPELAKLPRSDTIVCRCEDVRLGSLDASWGPRRAKLYTRAGMGPCQGRVCGPALAFLFGWGADAVRPPAKPVALANLLAPEETP